MAIQTTPYLYSPIPHSSPLNSTYILTVKAMATVLRLITFCVAIASTLILFSPYPTLAKGERKNYGEKKLNVIDVCWRLDHNWRSHRQRLARCSVGYAGKMTNNIGRNVTRYIVTDSSDDVLSPKPGTLRYGATHLDGKVWITFARDMTIKLHHPLLVSSYTTIDGRGANVQIAYGGCITLYEVTDVIIHGLRIYHCQPQEPGQVMGSNGKIETLAYADGDAITVVRSKKIWIDHNTMHECGDGLVDVTLGSTDITISNNWFKNHDMVMLLGHDDSSVEDQKMRVTVVFNYFGPDCDQRMPRVRQGFAHVVNNVYHGWGLYAIGGSMNPSVRSEANVFGARAKGRKEATWRLQGIENTWNFKSVNDLFENGATFMETIGGPHAIREMPPYSREQAFEVADAKSVRVLTWSSGALNCKKGNKCGFR